MIKFDINTCSLEGINLIEASAGTGKTHNISKLFIRLFIEKELNIDQILVVTFTEAATEELRSRIRNELNDAINKPDYKKSLPRLEYAVNNFDEASIFTIHSFCRKVLTENAFESSNLFETELITDQNTLLSDIVDDFFRILTSEESWLFIEYLYKNKINTDVFFLLVKNNISKPFLNIIPEINLVNAEIQEKEYKKIFKELKSYWKKYRNDIINILNSDVFNKNQYSSKIVKELTANTDIYFSSKRDESIILFEKFIKLTQNGLEKGLRKNCEYPSHLFFDKCGELLECNLKLKELYDSNILFYKIEIFKYIKEKLAIYKKKHNIQFYDDLLKNVYKSINKNGLLIKSINKKFKAALIDEFQDTDPLQYFIFKNIFKKSILFFIGDPKQAIYSFRGADIYAYLSALKEETTRKYTLSENWRSEESLIKAVNTVFAGRENPFLLENINFSEVKKASASSVPKLTYNGNNASCLNISVLENKDKKNISITEAEKISIKITADQILDILTDENIKIDNRKIIPEDIAVLVRKNIHATLIKKELGKRGIPGVLYSSENLFKSDDAPEFLRVLRAIGEPGDESNLLSALSTHYYTYTCNELFELSNNQYELVQIYEDFFRLKSMCISGSFIKMISCWMNEFNIRANLLNFDTGERKLTNLLHLIEVLHNITVKNQLSIDGLILWLSNAITDPDKFPEHQIRLETDKNAVKLVTIHKAKGLQYPVVFCPFLWYAPTKNNQIVFHNKDGRFFLDLQNQTQNIIIHENEQLAENLRIAYVAMTRARNMCCIITGRINGSENSGLSYLLYPSSDNRNSVLEDMEYKDIISFIKKLEEKSGSTIKYLPYKEQENNYFNLDSSVKCNLDFKKTQFSQEHNFRITSFSSLTHGAHNKYESRIDTDFGMDYDSSILTENSIEDKMDAVTIHTFPKGIKTGLLIHSIFENIDFLENSLSDKKKIAENIFTTYGYEEKWFEPLILMIATVLNKPLGNNKIILADINKNNILKEMEFLFPLEAVKKKDFINSFKHFPGADKHDKTNFYKKIEDLSINPIEGYVKGFIDLVFRYNNKYYIADWKSNFLGADSDEYNMSNMNNAILEEFYFLQYYFYTLALHKYLTVKDKNYSYKNNFGGVFYLFVRGINNENNNGIYYDLPKEEIIENLNKSLTGFKL